VRELHGITSRPHVLFVETFLDSSDSVFVARGDDLLPLGHWLPCSARVIATDVAALRACEEVLGCRSREISEARIVHGLSQAQGVIRNLLGKRLEEPPYAGISYAPSLQNIHCWLATVLREGAARCCVCAFWSFRIVGAILWWWLQAVVAVSAQMRPRRPRLRARPRRLRKRTLSHRARGAMSTDAWARLLFAKALRPCRRPPTA